MKLTIKQEEIDKITSGAILQHYNNLQTDIVLFCQLSYVSINNHSCIQGNPGKDGERGEPGAPGEKVCFFFSFQLVLLILFDTLVLCQTNFQLKLSQLF